MKAITINKQRATGAKRTLRLLPGALLAGIMGMNFPVGIFDHPALFWVVLALIIAVAPITLAVAKQRKWIWRKRRLAAARSDRPGPDLLAGR